MSDGDRARGRAGRGRSRGTPSAESVRSPTEGAPPSVGHGRGTAPSQSAWGRPQQQQQQAPKPMGPPSQQQQQQRPPATARGKQAMQQATTPITPRSEAGLAPGVQEMTGAFRGMQIAAAAAAASGSAERQGAQRRGAMRGRKEIGPPIHTKPENVKDKKGVSGQKIRVMSNHYKLIKTTDWSLYQYRVDFAPEEDRTSCRKGLLRAHKDTIGDTYMFDGTMLFTIRRLVMNNDQLELFSTREHDQERIRITIKFAAELALGDFQYIQLFNIILRNCIGSLNFQLVGREYFDPKGVVDLNNFKLMIWPGYVTSILQYETNIMMCIDVSHKVLRRDTVLDFLESCRSRYREDWEKKFTAAILGTVVFTHYNNKPYRVDDVDFQSTPNSTFKKGNEDVKYINYYKDKYNIVIRELRQPLLVSRPKAKDVRGGRDQNVVLIPELCNMTGLDNEMRGNFQLMKAVADHTRIPPNGRLKSYYDFLTRINRNQEAKSKLDKWNMKLSERLEEFQARRLEAETLILGQQKEISYDDTGDWTKNLRFSSMLTSIKLVDWVVIAPAQLNDRRGQGMVDNFLADLRKAANSLQFELNAPMKMATDQDKPSSYHLAIERAMSRGQLQLVMCIVPMNRTDIYSAIKKKCCIDRPVASQVITVRTLNHKNLLSVATKIIIQMNCKLGGAPWYIPLPFRVNDKPDPTMVVGFDVCHDTNMKGKSFGAVVASLDYHFSKFYSAVSAHSFGEELSNEIATHISHAVIRFRELNGKLPSRIIMYRDGVGESNIPFVLEHEVKMIQDRLEKTFPGFVVKLAVIIVSKRINTRIFTHDGQNPKPGTIVDDVVTQPEKFDFFIVSQSVRQGTVTPTSYNVIWDTLHLKPDIYQKLTYKMTHLYYNCSATVRVPAQVQYAHKLAFLVGQAIHQAPSTDLNGVLYFL